MIFLMVFSNDKISVMPTPRSFSEINFCNFFSKNMIGTVCSVFTLSHFYNFTGFGVNFIGPVSDYCSILLKSLGKMLYSLLLCISLIILESSATMFRYDLISSGKSFKQIRKQHYYSLNTALRDPTSYPHPFREGYPDINVCIHCSFSVIYLPMHLGNPSKA